MGALFFTTKANFHFKWFNCFCYISLGLSLTANFALITSPIFSLLPVFWLVLGYMFGILIAIPAYYSIWYSFLLIGPLASFSIFFYFIHIYAMIFQPKMVFIGNVLKEEYLFYPI